MPQTPKEARDAQVDELVKLIRRGMYRRRGDCPCDICVAHDSLDELAAVAKEMQ